MGRILDAIKKLQGWKRTGFAPGIERYILSGDESELGRISPPSGQYTFWQRELAGALGSPHLWGEEERRTARALVSARAARELFERLDQLLAQEKPEQDFLKVVAEAAGLDDEQLVSAVLGLERLNAPGGRPTSAGRYVLSLSVRQTREGMKAAPVHRWCALAELLVRHDIGRAVELADELLRSVALTSAEVAKILLEHGKQRFEPAVIRAQKRGGHGEFAIAEALHQYDAAKFGPTIVQAARKAVGESYVPAVEWEIEHFRPEMKADLVAYFARSQQDYFADKLLGQAARKLGRDSEEMVLAALDRGDRKHPYHVQSALQHLIALNPAGQAQRIEQELRQGLALKEPDHVMPFVNLAGRWDAAKLEGELWALLQHKSKPLRQTAARALGKLGDAALDKAVELLPSKKAEMRAAAVELLSVIGSKAALKELQDRLDGEPNDDVRDQMLLALSQAWKEQGRKISRGDIAQRVQRCAEKCKQPVAPWAKAHDLPKLNWKEGGALDELTVSYLFYRQSRAREMRADVEAQPLYELIDRASSGDFAKAILSGFLASKQEAQDRWALVMAGLLGDDRLVPDLSVQIRLWVAQNRGKLAEYAVQAMALLGSDAAMLAVDAMAIRYRNKMKNVGKAAAEAFAAAAENLGISTDELGDRVVPWLGFERGKPRTIEAGKTRLGVSIGPDLKLAFRDLEKGKPVKSLPKSLPPAVLAETKEDAANLREVVKAQVLRLENLLVRQRRWPAPRWKELFVDHPLLLAFAQKLVWGHYDAGGRLQGTFRALADRSLTTHEDETYDLADSGTVGMVHPLELEESARLAWRKHLADYEVEPPFAQLDREVVAVRPEQSAVKGLDELVGKSINAMTFKGRAERLGWHRGSVVDAGGINAYFKSFPGAAADVFLNLEGMYVGIDMYSDIQLGQIRFVRHGSVKTGSYTYDDPGDDSDPRVMSLGEVPAIAFSEAMADLKKISGGGGEGAQ